MNRSWNFRRGVLLALAGYTACLVFAAPQRCADALQAGLRLCGGPLLVSLFPFLTGPALAVGDLVAVGNTGAYARTLSPLLFSSHDVPAEFLI